MDTVLGVAFNNFAILASDKTENFGILRLSEDSSKIYQLTSHIAMGLTGESGDTDQFSRFVQCNFELEKFRDDGWEVTLKRAFHWITYELAQSIRSRSPFSVFPILAGYDTVEKLGKIYWIDYMGSGVDVTYGAHGYGEPLAIGYLDRHHKADMSEDQAIELVKGAIDAIQTRIIVGQNKFQMVLVNKDGVHNLPEYAIDRSKVITK